MPLQGSLYDAPLPEGFRYEERFLTEDEEGRLVDAIRSVTFADFQMHGTVARRRVAFFGRTYERSAQAPPIPEFLLPLRARAATWAGLDEAALVMALINDYPAGAPIGWHCDAPQYDQVVGISLLTPCRMRFRPWLTRDAVGPPNRRVATHELVLQPRSVYLLAGPARTAFEHHIPPVEAHRYSITFRTVREKRG